MFILKNWVVNLTSGVMGAVIFVSQNSPFFPIVVIICCSIIAIHNYAQGRWNAISDGRTIFRGRG